MKLSEKINYYRRRAKLSQEELAAQVGVSRQAVSKWELGDATPEVDKLLALARAFGVSTDELLSPSDPAPEDAGREPPDQDAPEPSPSAPPEDRLDHAVGGLGRLIRRYGWLTGVYVTLSGLMIAFMGGLMRFLFSGMFNASHQMMDGFGGMGGWEVQTSPGFQGDLSEIIASLPEDIANDVLSDLGGAAAGAAGAAGMDAGVSGIESVFLGFATAILVLGLVIALAGAVLAIILYRKGKTKKS